MIVIIRVALGEPGAEANILACAVCSTITLWHFWVKDPSVFSRVLPIGGRVIQSGDHIISCRKSGFFDLRKCRSPSQLSQSGPDSACSIQQHLPVALVVHQ